MEFFGWLAVIPRVVHAHDVFHLAVLVGAFFHWRFVWQFADGRPSESVPGEAWAAGDLTRTGPASSQHSRTTPTLSDSFPSG